MDFLDIAKFAALKASRRFADIDSEAREDMVSEAICAVLEKNPSTAQEAARVGYYSALNYGYHWMMNAGITNHRNVANVASLEKVPERFLEDYPLDEAETPFQFDRYERVLKSLLLSVKKRGKSKRGQIAAQNEIEILKLCVEGYSTKIIAEKMNMSEGAVKKSRQTIRKTLQKIEQRG